MKVEINASSLNGTGTRQQTFYFNLRDELKRWKHREEEMREFSTTEEAAHYLGVTVEQMVAWRENDEGPVITNVGNQPRCYQRRDLHAFRRDMLGQSGI